MNILLLTHDYPPVGGGGVQRPLHLVRSLSAAGHKVHVIAVDKDPGLLRDDSLLERHPASAPITRYRLPSIGPILEGFKRARLSRVPTLVLPSDLYVDATIFHRSTVRAALRVCETFYPDVIVASGPPFGVFEAARRVAAATDAALVLDLRDPWVEPIVGRFPSSIAFRWARAMQRRCFRAADSVVVTAPTLQHLLETLPIGRPRRVVTITNGFDAGISLNEGVVEKARVLCGGSERVRTVAFIGRLFVSSADGHSRRGAFADALFGRIAFGREVIRANDYHAGPWFHALSILAGRRPDLHGKLQTVFLGNVPKQGELFPRALEAFPVRYAGYQPSAIAAAAARIADGLALFNPSTIDDSPSFIIPGKLFEYLAAGPPIFAMCGPGDCADIIGMTGAGLWVHDRRPEEMAAHLERWLSGEALPIVRDEGRIARYERAVLGRRFVEEVERSAVERGRKHPGSSRLIVRR